MNLDWDDATKTYNLTKKSIDDRENFKLKQELKGVGKQEVEKTQAYSPDQVAAMTDKAEQAGGVWSEVYQAFKMPDGSIQAATNTPTWENGAYQQAGKAVNPNTQYTFGNKTRATDFTPDEVKGLKMQSRADIYRNYGRDTEADQLEAAGLQRRSAMQAINKGDREAKYEKDWDEYTTAAGTLNNKFAETDKQVEKMLKTGDYVGAARLMAQFRTDIIPDSRAIIVGQDGSITGIDTDGTTVKSDKSAFNPNVVASMRSDLKSSMGEYLKSKRPSQGFERDRQLGRDETQDSQWNTTRNDGQKARGEDVDYRNVAQANQKEQWGKENGYKDRALDQAWKINQANLASAAGIADRANARAMDVARITKGAYETLIPYGAGPDGKPVFQSNQNGVVTLDEKGNRVQVTDVSKVKRFVTEAKDNTKAQEAYWEYLDANPDATPDQKLNRKIEMGLAPPREYNESPNDEGEKPKGAGLTTRPVGNINSPLPNGTLPIGKDGNIIMEKPAGFVRPNPWTSNPN